MTISVLLFQVVSADMMVLLSCTTLVKDHLNFLTFLVNMFHVTTTVSVKVHITYSSVNFFIRFRHHNLILCCIMILLVTFQWLFFIIFRVFVQLVGVNYVVRDRSLLLLGEVGQQLLIVGLTAWYQLHHGFVLHLNQ